MDRTDGSETKLTQTAWDWLLGLDVFGLLGRVFSISVLSTS